MSFNLVLKHVKMADLLCRTVQVYIYIKQVVWWHSNNHTCTQTSALVHFFLNFCCHTLICLLALAFSIPPLSCTHLFHHLLAPYAPSPVFWLTGEYLKGNKTPLSLFSPPSFLSPACKRKEEDRGRERNQVPKKQRLVFTDLQRRTLVAIFRENRRPSKEMQITISQQLGLELSTVSNFFMNSRRRSVDRWDPEEHGHGVHGHMHTPHGHNNNNNNNNNNASPIQPGTSSATTFSKAWRWRDRCWTDAWRMEGGRGCLSLKRWALTVNPAQLQGV